ncbi:MAG TPA: hypothetical protein VHS57_08780 [Acidimicrobiales bacterium]|nr:hypothetical protein [Acidimicrobiales bacterium]
MKGRIRIAACGLVVMAVMTAVTSTAGAATTVTKWNVTGNGGFVGLKLLSALQIAGGGSEADAGSGPVAEAEGTGLCVNGSPTTNPCPTSATSPAVGTGFSQTQSAVANAAGMTATPKGGGSGCTIPVNVPGLLSVDVSCGTASAAEDAGSNPSATGSGDLANVSISLGLTQVLQSILGGALPTATSSCSGAPAATTGAGSNTSLDGTLTGILGTVNGLLGGLTHLNPTSVASGSDLTGECSILGGLLNQLTAANGAGSVVGIVTGILDQLLGLAGGAGVSVTPLSIDLGGSSTSVSTSGNVVTDSVTQHAIDINLFGLADLQVAPTTAAVALDRSTGTVTPSCNAGVASYSIASGVQQFLSLGSLTSLVNNILAQLSGALNSLLAPLQTLIGDLLSYNPTGNLLNCNVSAPGTTANAQVGVANLGLLTGLMGGIGLNVGDVSVSGSSTVATPAAVTTAAATPAATPAAAAPAAAAPAAVPNVTSVHTGEWWAGDLPVILLAGMALAGAMLIGRRRILSVARSIHPLARRNRGGQ